MANCYSGDLDVDFVINILDGFVMIHGISALPAAELERYPGEFAARLLAHLPFSAELFHMVEQLLPGQEALYWQSAAVPYIYSETDPYELKAAVGKLMEYERYAAVVNLLGRSVADHSVDWLGCKGVEEETLYRALIMAGTTESSADTLDSYAAKNLIKKLQQRDEPEREQLELLSQIEFIYLPWLDECTLEHTRALYVKLANDPDSFCRIIEVYYRRRHEKEAGAEEQKKQRAQKQLPQNISRRLSQIILRFAVIPGTDWNGNFHEDVFESWMECVKAWSRENDRYEAATSIVGSGLSYFRTSTCEGLLPDELIMRTLDAADGVYLRRGYESGIVNQRGAYWVDPSGEPERRLAATYERMADQAEALGYSRYAETLRQVAETYEKEAGVCLNQKEC